MFIFRILGLLLVVLALMLLGADVVSSLEKGVDIWSGALTVRSLDQVLVLMQWDIKPWIETTLPEPVAGWLMTFVGWPSWADLGVPGMILNFLGGMGE